jgi:prevent-host-death family protein
MRFIEEADAQARFVEVLDEAQEHPIIIRRQGKDFAAIVSLADYEHTRLANVQSFLELRKEIASEATMSGLTEEKLAELLSDGDL